jgi:hypothetical protein
MDARITYVARCKRSSRLTTEIRIERRMFIAENLSETGDAKFVYVDCWENAVFKRIFIILCVCVCVCVCVASLPSTGRWLWSQKSAPKRQLNFF